MSYQEAMKVEDDSFEVVLVIVHYFIIYKPSKSAQGKLDQLE